MKVHLNQQEIESAIIAYVGNQGISVTGKYVSVELTAGRGEKGMSAAIDISNEEPPASATVNIPTKEDPAQMPLPFGGPPVTVTPKDDAPDQSAPPVIGDEPEDKPLFGKG